jgi:aminoglycoside phosphotransferase family enzyme
MASAEHLAFVPSTRAEPAGEALEAKLAFLSAPGAFPGTVGAATRRETHMSWVFFAGERVFKLKKPIRLPYLDFSTLTRRKSACDAEYRLNQSLAPGVYEGVVPLVRTDGKLRIGGRGDPVDWLVQMRRLDLARTLEARLADGALTPTEIDRLAERIADFYKAARRPLRTAATQLPVLRAAMAFNRRILLDPTLGMPRGAVRAVLAVQERFLRRGAGILASRARSGCVIEAHGDLRPEHIWMGPPILVIDRLEFSAELRCIDWLEELCFLEVETKACGAADVGTDLRRGVCARLHDRPPEVLTFFYISMRALLRARLAIAHLLEPDPRTPEKWPRQARDYLFIAQHAAGRLEKLLRRPGDP